MNSLFSIRHAALLGMGIGMLAAAGHASRADAFFDVQALAGKRWYELEFADEKHGVASQEVSLAAHIDPIPVVPVSFGVSVALGTMRAEDLGADSGTVIEPALDVSAWVPMVPVVTPYARLKVPVMAKTVWKGKADFGAGEQDYVQTSNLSGFHLGAGVKWSPVPVLKLLLELQRGMEQWETDEYKIAGAKQTVDKKKQDASSNAVFFGLEIGL